jgi:hypothetical protein
MRRCKVNRLRPRGPRARRVGWRIGKILCVWFFALLTVNGAIAHAAFIQEQKLSGSNGVVAFAGNRIVAGGNVFRFDPAAMEWVHEQTLTALNGTDDDQFGWSVAGSADRIVVGAPFDRDSAPGSGAAYVFRYDPVSMTWMQEQKLLASGGEFTSIFGWSVAITGNRIVVGAPGNSERGSQAGAAYVYRFDSGVSQWVLEKKLTAEDGVAHDLFGIDVTLDGERIAVGAWFAQDQAGAAYVFRFDSSGMTWVQEQKLVPVDGQPGDLFGVSIGISGDRVVAGNGHCCADDGPYRAYVFRYDAATITWQQEQKLQPSSGSSSSNFGFDVAISGGRIVVGAFGEHAAYVFRYDNTTAVWAEEQRLSPQDGAGEGGFGASVALAGDRILVGTSGYIFQLSSDDEGPVVSAVIPAPNPVTVGTDILLTATVDDSHTGGSTIMRADFKLNGGVPIPMDATDGTFDAMREDVQATISAFTHAGVHQICVDGTDIVGNIGAEECVFLVVYDPVGGFVTGGGWIESPPGAYTLQPSLAGVANFGFVSKYQKGANIPTGVTNFRFRLAGLDFHSDNYQWLVMAGARAQFKGLGTINGGGIYGFLLTAIDGQIAGGGGVDKFRIKIWEEASGVIVYDNKLGSDDFGNDATELGGGNIVIQKG